MSVTKIPVGGSSIVRCYYVGKGWFGKDVLPHGPNCYEAPSAGFNQEAPMTINGTTNSYGITASWTPLSEKVSPTSSNYVDVTLSLDHTEPPAGGYNEQPLLASSTNDLPNGEDHYSGYVDVYSGNYKPTPPCPLITITTQASRRT